MVPRDSSAPNSAFLAAHGRKPSGPPTLQVKAWSKPNGIKCGLRSRTYRDCLLTREIEQIERPFERPEGDELTSLRFRRAKPECLLK
jgi:hypothetical protein